MILSNESIQWAHRHPGECTGQHLHWPEAEGSNMQNDECSAPEGAVAAAVNMDAPAILRLARQANLPLAIRQILMAFNGRDAGDDGAMERAERDLLALVGHGD